MGYNINYTDLRAFQNTVNLLIEGWKQNLQWVLEDINALVNSDSYRGQAADSMRLYLQDVTGNITITLINILCEYSGKLNRYIQGFYAYDNGWQAVLNEDAMQAVMDTFSHIIQETMDSYDRIKDSMDSVSDQLPSSLLTQQAYVVSMIGERDSIYRLRESVGEYDAAAGTEQPTLQEEVETLLQIIKQQVENPPCSVTGYTAEVWQATDTYGDLERIYNASHWYLNSHERSILEAQQSYIDTLDRIQEDLSKERWEKGYELVMVSSASALSLVLSSGLLTTGTLTAETAALSTVAAAFVYSDYIEGVQEMYYGCVGDISSASVNPLKDTVFGGWEEGYRTAEMLSIGVASYSGMQDIARAEQAAQLEQIYAQKAEQIAYSEVDIDELSNLEWDGGQYAERIEIGSEGGSNSKNPMTGDDWHNYFNEKYGTENVTWESASIQDIIDMPSKITDFSPKQISDLARRNGWTVEPLGKGSLAGIIYEQGGGISMHAPNGSSIYIQYHPGGGHHGVMPYYKVSSGKNGIVRYYINGERAQ